MRYIKWIIPLSLILVALLVVFLRKNKSFSKKDTRFAIENINSVDRIKIANSEEEVILLLENGKWKMDGSEARRDMVKLLLNVSGNLQAVMPLPEEECDSARLLLREKAKVTFFKGRKKLGYFAICSWKNKTIGMQGASKHPFVLSSSSLPNTELSLLFNPSPVFWTSNMFIDLQPSQISSIQVSYPLGGKKMFTIERDEKGNPTILEPAGNNQAYDFHIIDEYLYFFTDIQFVIDEEISTPQQRSEILKTPVLWQLKITTSNKQVKSLTAYPKRNGNSGQTDLFNFYGMSSDSTLILLKYSDFDPILLDRDYFLKK